MGKNQTFHKKEKKTTQKVLNQIENKLNECINNKTKLNESLIFLIIDFLYKSLESVKINKPFEKITFNSKYMCIIFKLLYECMNECLIDLELFNKKNQKNYISLHNILKNIINKNVTIPDKINASNYKQNINKIKIAIENINDIIYIQKLMNYYIKGSTKFCTKRLTIHSC